MTITIRLYWQYDLDLIGLYMDPTFHLGIKIKEALQGYVRGRKVIFHVPDMPSPEHIIVESCAVTISLNDRYDADVIRFIKSIRLGHRNSAIKNLMRNCFDQPFLIPYLYTDIYTSKSRVHQEPKGYTAKGKARKGTDRSKSVPKRIKNREYYQKMQENPNPVLPEPEKKESVYDQFMKNGHNISEQNNEEISAASEKSAERKDIRKAENTGFNGTDNSDFNNSENAYKANENVSEIRENQYDQPEDSDDSDNDSGGFSIFDSVSQMF